MHSRPCLASRAFIIAAVRNRLDRLSLGVEALAYGRRLQRARRKLSLGNARGLWCKVRRTVDDG